MSKQVVRVVVGLCLMGQVGFAHFPDLDGIYQCRDINSHRTFLLQIFVTFSTSGIHHSLSKATTESGCQWEPYGQFVQVFSTQDISQKRSSMKIELEVGQDIDRVSISVSSWTSRNRSFILSEKKQSWHEYQCTFFDENPAPGTLIPPNLLNFEILKVRQDEAQSPAPVCLDPISEVKPHSRLIPKPKPTQNGLQKRQTKPSNLYWYWGEGEEEGKDEVEGDEDCQACWDAMDCGFESCAAHQNRR